MERGTNTPPPSTIINDLSVEWNLNLNAASVSMWLKGSTPSKCIHSNTPQTTLIKLSSVKQNDFWYLHLECNIYLVFELCCLRPLKMKLTLKKFFVVIPTDDGRFLCRKCGKKYVGKQLVLSHILFECGVQPVIQCPLCPRKCKRNDVLQTHLKNIHGIH